MKECAEQGTSCSIPAVHIAYSATCGRLQHFSLLVKVWPECVEQLQLFIANNQDNTLNTDNEMVSIDRDLRMLH